MDLSQSWVTDQQSHLRSSSDSYRLYSSPVGDVAEGIRRPHSTKKDFSPDPSSIHKRHPVKDHLLEDNHDLKKSADSSSKSLSDGNVTKLTDSAPSRSISHPLSVSQVRGNLRVTVLLPLPRIRLSCSICFAQESRTQKEDEETLEDLWKVKGGKEMGETKR